MSNEFEIDAFSVDQHNDKERWAKEMRKDGCMTVADLINALRSMPQDALLRVAGGFDEYETLHFVRKIDDLRVWLVGKHG